MQALGGESAPPLWARTIAPGTDRPIFASRDGVKVHSLAAVDRERRTGSGWHVTTPLKLIETDYPAWRARLATGQGGGSRGMAAAGSGTV